MINELKLELVREQAESTLELCRDYERAWREVDKFRLEAARYKALFFHKEALSEQLADQLRTNLWVGYSYSSDSYKNLEGMHDAGLITKEEYEFCNV